MLRRPLRGPLRNQDAVPKIAAQDLKNYCGDPQLDETIENQASVLLSLSPKMLDGFTDPRLKA